jgi:hypothetical protein
MTNQSESVPASSLEPAALVLPSFRSLRPFVLRLRHPKHLIRSLEMSIGRRLDQLSNKLDTLCRPAGLIARDRSNLMEGGACLPFRSHRGVALLNPESDR